MTVIIKVNPIQIRPSQGSGLGRGVQKSLCWCQRNETWKKGLKYACLCHLHCALCLYNKKYPESSPGQEGNFR